MEAIDVMRNCFIICLIIVVSLSYCYSISSNLPKGAFRLISLIPIVYIFTILNLHLGSAYAILAISFFITWVCNLKLLRFAFDQGPLSWQKCKLSLPIFITIALLPIKTNENNDPPKKISLKFIFAIKALLFALFSHVIYYRGILSPQLLDILYCAFTYFVADNVVEWSCWIATSITGFEFDKLSYDPYLSTSLQEFWGRRWNLSVSNSLRHTIYFPVRRSSEKVLGKGLSSTCVGVVATFLVSGLMHELLYYHLTLVTPSWEVTLYFVVHGIVVAVEIVLKKRLKGKFRLPWFVSGSLTMGFVVITSRRLLSPPLMRIGFRLDHEFKLSLEYFKSYFLDFSSLSSFKLF